MLGQEALDGLVDSHIALGPAVGPNCGAHLRNEFS
jgi:hypothetical protein